MATETITVQDVEKTDSGWFEITLVDDNRKVSTRDRKVADVAMQSRGTAIEAEINSVKRGKFENHYLNKIGDVGETRSEAPRSNGSPARSGGRSPQENDRIARQWAYGRAVELLALSDDLDVSKGLTDGHKTFLTETAAFLLDQTKG